MLFLPASVGQSTSPKPHEPWSRLLMRSLSSPANAEPVKFSTDPFSTIYSTHQYSGRPQWLRKQPQQRDHASEPREQAWQPQPKDNCYYVPTGRDAHTLIEKQGHCFQAMRETVF